MIVACGVCAHWIFWTVFPPATPWALTFTGWFLALAILARIAGVRFLGVPRLAVALVLVLAAFAVGSLSMGPLPGFAFAPSCLAGSVSALRRAKSRPALRKSAWAVTALGLLSLVVLGFHSYQSYRNLSPAARVLEVESSPATSIELRRIPKGDCASLKAVAGGAKSISLIQAVQRRMVAECSRK